jgi:hypothetical protein
MIRTDTINKLIEIYKGDKKFLDIIERSISTFEEYHNTIFKMELWMKIYSKSITGEEYKDNVSKLDKMRTVNHNSVIANVNLLNRLAEKNGLQPVYDGIVSEERPYRREIANAVLDYVESIIKNRR